MRTLRSMSVSGSFYSANPDELIAYINHFNAILESHPKVLEHFDSLQGNAFIVPHAGWIYSGFTANMAYRILQRTDAKTVVVFGPSHRVGFDGISIADSKFYQTPLGDIPMDTSLVLDLKERFSLVSLEHAHHEHSTEVQMPFIKHYMPDTQVVEMVYSNVDPMQISPIIDYLLELQGVAVIISTDLSHFYPLEKAKQLDSICLKAIQSSTSSTLYQGCEACGKIGVAAMLDVAHKRKMKSEILDYRTSADASGDSTRVVGYVSAIFRS